MAIQWLEWDGIFSSSPNWYRCVGYEEIGRDSTSVTIKIYLKLKLKGNSSSTFYGYPAFWDINDGTDMKIKGTERWYGGQDYRTFTTTLRVNANAGGGSASFKLNVWSKLGGNASFDKHYTFNYSKWNTKPYWNANAKVTIRENNAGGRIISSEPWGTENAYKFPENIGCLYVSWDNAIDPDGNQITYELYQQKNDGGWNVIDVGTDTCHQFGIPAGSGTQGDSYDFYVRARDSYGEYADGEANATQVQKNQFTRAMLNHSGNISPSSNNISLSYNGASNTNGNGTFYYKLSCEGLTVYNDDKFSGGTINVAIYKGGDIPKTPYIKYSDLKNKVQGSYRGNIRFVLETKNDYGSSGGDYEDIWVDLQQAPSSFNFGDVSGALFVAGGKYFIPSEHEVTLTWGSSVDPNGTKVKYDLYYAYDNVAWIPLATDLTTNTFTGNLPSVDKKTIATFRVVAKTAYGTTRATEGGRTEFHYIRFPSVTTSVTRNQNDFTINGKVTINTSIANVKLTPIMYKVAGSQYEQANTKGLEFTIHKNLSETSSTVVNIVITDEITSRLQTGETSVEVQISRYMPMFSIREKGVGINAIPDDSAKFIVNGKAKVKELCVEGYETLYTGADNHDKWVKIATLNIRQQYANVQANLKFLGSGSGGDTSSSGELVVRLKQQNAMGQEPVGSIYLFNNTLITPDCFKLIITSNTKSITTGELWFKNTTWHEGVKFYPIKTDNEIYFHEKQPFQNELPKGKQIGAKTYNLTSNMLSEGNNVYGRIPQIGGDGVMEIGRYIDFHLPNSKADFDGRLTLQDNKILRYNGWMQADAFQGGNLRIGGNDFCMNNKRALVGWGNPNDPLIVNFAGDFKGGIKMEGYTQVTGQLDCRSQPAKWGSQFIAQTSADGNGSGDGQTHIGYNGGNGYSHYFRGTGGFYVNNHLGIHTNKIDVEEWIQAPQLWVKSNGGVYSGHNNAYILKDHGNGNVTLSGAGGQLYLGYQNTTSIKVEQEYWDLGASSGCMIRMSSPWSGSAGSEPAIFNGKGKGWGFLGNSDWSWFRIYGNGGTVSQRNTKYDIHKFDDVLLYDYVKQLNTYAYRTITDEKDENNEIIDTLKRSDMQLGCMIEEMPTEVVFYDGEGGNGGAVDNYAYTTMILGATKVLQDKVEKLEEDNEGLKEEIESLKAENKDLKNRLLEIERMLKANGTN